MRFVSVETVIPRYHFFSQTTMMMTSRCCSHWPRPSAPSPPGRALCLMVLIPAASLHQAVRPTVATATLKFKAFCIDDCTRSSFFPSLLHSPLFLFPFPKKNKSTLTCQSVLTCVCVPLVAIASCHTSYTGTCIAGAPYKCIKIFAYLPMSQGHDHDI